MKRNVFVGKGLVAGSCLALILSLVSLGTVSANAAPGNANSQTLAAAQALLAAETAPTKIGISIPLKATPPKGKTIVFMNNTDVQQSSLYAPGIAAGAKALGWKFKIITDQQANPATLVTGMRQALQYKPVAVIMNGIPYSSWSQVVPAYKKAHVIIIPLTDGAVPTTAVTPVNIYGPKGGAVTGALAANVFIYDSQATGTTLDVEIPSIPIFDEISGGLKAQIASKCTACTVVQLQASLAEVFGGTLVPAIVAAVQANPSINYVTDVDCALTPGLHAALATIGRGSVGVICAAGGTQDYQDVVTGATLCTIPGALPYMGILAVDAAARHLEGMKISVGDGTIPAELIVQSNAGTPTDVLATPWAIGQFKKLWKVK